MHKVAGPDAAFLYGERPEWHFHVSAVVIVDPSDAGDSFSIDAVREALRRRIHRVPQFRWKLMTQVAGIDRPVFVDDPDFDVKNHVRHVALPAPGDKRALGQLVGQLVSFKIDRLRPLWEMWYVEGLEGGRVAVLTKIHHSIIDGVSGSDLATILFDIEPHPEPDPEPPPYIPDPPPTALRMAAEAAGALATWPIRTMQYSAQVLQQGITVARHALRDEAPVQPFQAPRTMLNGQLTGTRQFAYAAIPLADVKRIKNVFDVKLNDVILALSGGVLRSYLIDHDELPMTPLIAQVPVSIRTDEDRNEVGTKVAAMFASLATHLDDPADRVQAVHDSTQSAKEMRTALSAQHIMGLTDATPPALISLAATTITRSGLEARTPPVFNLIISNVPGPPFELFMCGAPIEAMFPMGPLLFGSGINFTVISTADRIDFGFMTCPEMVPDPWDVAARVQPALDELLAAADAKEAADRTAAKATSAKKPSKTKKSAAG